MKKNLLLISIILTSTSLYANRMSEAGYLEKISQYHENEIEMSKLALSKSKNKDVEKMARKMIKEQTKEIKKIDRLRSTIYSDVIVTKTSNNIPGFGELEKTSGKEFDKKYLEMIAAHHRSEILMTSKILPELKRDEVHHIAVKLAKNKGNELEKLEKIKNSL
jgi:putative membrane protein